MDSRKIVLGIALFSTFALGAMTLTVLFQEGLDILVVVSLIVVGLFAFGIVGALMNPPEDDDRF